MPAETPKFNPEIPENQENILKGIVFEKKVKPDGQVEFRSSAPDRKLVVLEKFSPEPPEDAPCEVEIVEDTEPGDPTKGKLIVRIAGTAPMIDRVRERGGKHPLPIEFDPEANKVLVLETELDWNKDGGKLVPRPEKFSHFTLDEKTLRVIEKVATAVELKEPCLLEGETSTSKTSGIEYLAMRTNNEVVRFNLNGQTDTSELIGKFVPNDGQLQVEFEKILKEIDSLTDQSRQIVTRANSEGRGLTLIESQKIAQAEGIKTPDWRWQDGLVPEAMKKGRWLVLDEINLAEPQILERINSVLEKNPSITLSENGGTKIGPGGESEVDKNFRIFATMNPSEYAGRAPMSPAYKDRWTSYLFAEIPGEKDYRAMIDLMTYGKQPEIQVGNKTYQGDKVESLFPKLSALSGFETFVPKMAKFQAVIEELARERKIGKDRKEKYIFTRRGLIEFLHYLESKSFVDRQTGRRVTINDSPETIVQRAIQYYYLDKISGVDDLKKVEDQLGAIGISKSNWTHQFKAPKKPRTNKPGKPKNSADTPELESGPQEFVDFAGSKLRSTGETERDGIKIGDRFKSLTPEKTFVSALSNTKEITIVGFLVGNLSHIIGQTDNGKIMSFALSRIQKTTEFQKLPPEEGGEGGGEGGGETNSGPQEFVDYIGTKFQSTGETERSGLKVGDKFKVVNPIIFAENLQDTQEVTIVGFQQTSGLPIVKADTGKIFTIRQLSNTDIYQKLPTEGETNSGPQEFVAFDGRKLLSTGETERGGLKVGDKFKEVNPKIFGKNLQGTQEVTIVGFEELSGLPILKADTGKIFTSHWLSDTSMYQKLP